jgi:hypothetical protein
MGMESSDGVDGWFHPAQQRQAILSARRTTYPGKLGQESGVLMPIGRHDLMPEAVEGCPIIGRERPASASRHIPWSQPLLPIPIQASTGHVCQIERRGTSTTHALGGQVQGHARTARWGHRTSRGRGMVAGRGCWECGRGNGAKRPLEFPIRDLRAVWFRLHPRRLVHRSLGTTSPVIRRIHSGCPRHSRAHPGRGGLRYRPDSRSF